MKQLNTLLIALLLISFELNAQNQDFIPELNSKLENYLSTFPNEKVFIIIDKDIYKPGETIWFSAFVNNAGNHYQKFESKELIIKIYDHNGKVINADRYLLNNGKANGDFELSAEINEGTYYLIAFTDIHQELKDVFSKKFQIISFYPNDHVIQVIPDQEITKAGEEARFYIIINDMDGNPVSKESFVYSLLKGNSIIEKGKEKTDENGKAIIQVPTPEKSNGAPLILELSDKQDNWAERRIIPTTSDKILITFYPEGENIIPDIPVKVGFTAYNAYGHPVNVEGEIIDEQGNKITQVKSFIEGYGLFPLLAKSENTYFLKLTGETGKGQQFELPKTNPDKPGLAIPKIDTENIYINIYTSNSNEQEYALTVANFNGLGWGGNIVLKGPAKLKIPTDEISDGVNLVTLFDSGQNPVANRLIYLDKNESLDVQVDIKNTTVLPQETSEFRISLKDKNGNPINGQVSIAISDRFDLTDETTSLQKYLEINSLIWNKIPDNQEIGSRVLDFILITNKLKDFDWARILQLNKTTKTENTLTISGKVVDKNGNVVPFAKVSLIDKSSIHFFSEAADNQGNFSISGLDPSEKNNYMASATGPNGEKEYDIIYNKNFEEQLSDMIANKYAFNEEILSVKEIVNYFNNNPGLFDEKPERKQRDISNRNENIRRYLENGVAILDVIKMIKPYNLTGNKIIFYGSQNSFVAQDGALIVVDGQQLGTDATILSSLSPTDIDRINVSTNAMDIQRYSGLNSVGLIEIFTKRGLSDNSEKPSPKLSENLYNGEFRIPKSFTIPKENSEDDFRTTLLWIPIMKTDESGSVELSFPTSLVRSEFQIRVKGISSDGKAGEGSATFNVENN